MTPTPPSSTQGMHQDEIDALRSAVAALGQQRDLDADETAEVRAIAEKLDQQVNQPPHAMRDVLAVTDDRSRANMERLNAMSTQPNDGGFWGGLARALERPWAALLAVGAPKLTIIALTVLLAMLLLTGQLIPLIHALQGPSVQLTVEPGSTVTTPQMDADALEIDAAEVNVTEGQEIE